VRNANNCLPELRDNRRRTTIPASFTERCEILDLVDIVEVLVSCYMTSINMLLLDIGGYQF